MGRETLSVCVNLTMCEEEEEDDSETPLKPWPFLKIFLIINKC